jgi:FtsP/CotA-like multicopper oxidase with cupredoxin domain
MDEKRLTVGSENERRLKGVKKKGKRKGFAALDSDDDDDDDVRSSHSSSSHSSSSSPNDIRILSESGELDNKKVSTIGSDSELDNIETIDMDDDDDNTILDDDLQDRDSLPVVVVPSTAPRLSKNPWTRLSRRTKTIVIISVSFVILLALISAILIPMGGASSETRVYYIQADEVDWDYGPMRFNAIKDAQYDDVSSLFMVKVPRQRVGSRYKKARYVRYTNDKYDERFEEADGMGILGPTIFVEVGDEIEIHFRNNLRHATSMFSHGVEYDVASEGDSYAHGAATYGSGSGSGAGTATDALVEPGETRKYRWRVPDEAGPEASDGAAVAWLYHPQIGAPADINTGLVGFVVVSGLDEADSSGAPAEASRNLPLFAAVFDENRSVYLNDTLSQEIGASWDVALLDALSFVESNRMASINGLMYGQLQGVYAKRDQYVHLYFGAASLSPSDPPLHTLEMHANTFVVHGNRFDTVGVPSLTAVTAAMRPQNKGTWRLHSTLSELTEHGMDMLYTIK